MLILCQYPSFFFIGLLITILYNTIQNVYCLKHCYNVYSMKKANIYKKTGNMDLLKNIVLHERTCTGNIKSQILRREAKYMNLDKLLTMNFEFFDMRLVNF